jgi:uncharacterized protein YceK
MKKNVLIKGILVLLVIALLTIGFSGCGTIIPPTTGTAIITIAGYYTMYNYDVYLDSWYNQIGATSGGTLMVTGLTPGSHTFYVEDNYYYYYYESGTVYINAGITSYLTLYPY